ncbi:MAG: hypothetical protein AB1411_02820 [Nitrospirota bacterium]
MARLTLALVLAAVLAGCAGLTSRPWFGSDSQGYWLPLTVNLQLDPSVTGAGLEYNDACGQAQVLQLGDRFRASLKREIGMTFEHLQMEGGPQFPGPSEPPDAVVQVSLGLKELRLFIPRHETNSYAAAVSLGATVNYVDVDGTVLYTKSLKTEARGNVDTERDACDVQGLADLANEAVAKMAEGFKKHLGSSTKIQQVATAKRQGRRPVVAGIAPGASKSGPDLAATAAGPAAAAPAQQGAPTALSFRAMLKDEGQDQVLEGEERVTLRVEVKNEGPGFANGVVVALKGGPVLAKTLPAQIPVGDLAPGESKRVEASGTLPVVSDERQGELTVSVEAASPVLGQIRPKKFIAAMRPGRAEQLEVLSVDVDQVPRLVRGAVRRNAAAVAIGIGTYRDPDLSGVKFAVHDAEIMAQYFQNVIGIPEDRVKLLTDEHVLKPDLAEVFEDWLPQRVGPDGLVLIYFSGRAVVDPATGAVSLLPHEGSPEAPLKAFSLRRLQTALTRLPIQRAILMLDVTPMGPTAAIEQDDREPVWVAPSVTDGKLVQLLSTSKIQTAQQHEAGQHGLFTYYLLKGLRGAADKDKNGVVALGELFDYARVQVIQTAKAQYGREQEPACVPALDPTHKAWNLPLARLK